MDATAQVLNDEGIPLQKSYTSISYVLEKQLQFSGDWLGKCRGNLSHMPSKTIFGEMTAELGKTKGNELDEEGSMPN